MAELKRVTLPGTSVTTTAIGFGCSNLLGGKTRAEGLLLLQSAYEVGIRHFDVARYYSFGDAEGLLGEFTRGRRDRITITTKFGLQPNRRLAKARGPLQLLRRMMRASPFVRDLVRRRSATVVESGRFDVESARESLETSLRELKTDYVDLYLLHECEPQDCRPELLAFLEQARAAGKIRAFGIGTAFARAEAVCEQAPAFTAVAQFESSILAPNVRQIARLDRRLDGGKRALITHGSFAAASALRERMRADAGFAGQLKSTFGIEGPRAPILGGLILQQALHANPEGIVLFRSADPDRIISNIRAAAEASFSLEQLDRFEALVAGFAPLPVARR
jgi:D-threo-aldose 1-dehydrogenase